VLLARRKDLATPNWGWQVGYRASRDVFYSIEKIAWPVFHFYSASAAGRLPRGQQEPRRFGHRPTRGTAGKPTQTKADFLTAETPRAQRRALEIKM